MKRTLIFTAFIFCTFLQVNAQIFATAGKAINGYDPVAFFKSSKAVKGADSLSYQWKGVIWLFSDKENMNAFKESPEKYIPQYGGYCAYGTADGHQSPSQIDTWTIVDDKLYFNYNSKVKEMWAKDQKALIMKADSNWLKLKKQE
jgi:YHS domain-containing protein